MLVCLKKVHKPVIAFKIFAGGQMLVGKTQEEKREIIKGVYEEVFTALNPNAIVWAGMFFRFSRLSSVLWYCKKRKDTV